MKPIIPIILTAILCACTSGAKKDHHRLNVTVSIPPQAWILERIAGDSVNINTLIAAGGNPETFEPGVNLIKSTASSDILMLSGQLGFESQLARRIIDGNNDIKVVDTSRGVKNIYGTHSHHGHKHHDHDTDEHESTADPHTWTSVSNARIIAGNMLQALVEADPQNASYYRERAQTLDHHLDSLDKAIARRLASNDTKGFLIWHPSLSYYARDYGLNQITIGSEGREPTVNDLRNTIDKTRKADVTVLFMQADFDPRQAVTLSKETGLKVISINPLDPDWESQIETITNALEQ